MKNPVLPKGIFFDAFARGTCSLCEQIFFTGTSITWFVDGTLAHEYCYREEMKRLTARKEQEPSCAEGCDGAEHNVVEYDPVGYPQHYNSHPSGVECITVTEHFNFNLGNAIKYVWRAGLKSENPLEDLEKAVWFLQREVKRLEEFGE